MGVRAHVIGYIGEDQALVTACACLGSCQLARALRCMPAMLAAVEPSLMAWLPR